MDLASNECEYGRHPKCRRKKTCPCWCHRDAEAE
jgi:hypothetical protein